jgi:hypothetical protein
MRRLLFVVTVVALMVVMSVAPALAKSNQNWPANKLPSQGYSAYNMCYYGHPGDLQGGNHAAQC